MCPPPAPLPLCPTCGRCQVEAKQQATQAAAARGQIMTTEPEGKLRKRKVRDIGARENLAGPPAQRQKGSTGAVPSSGGSGAGALGSLLSAYGDDDSASHSSDSGPEQVSSSMPSAASAPSTATAAAPASASASTNNDTRLGVIAGAAADAPDTPDARAAPRPTKRFCRLFGRGKCTRGDQCKFSHDYHDRALEEQWRATKTGSRVCKYFVRGKCNNGAKCRFSHAEAAVSAAKEARAASSGGPGAAHRGRGAPRSAPSLLRKLFRKDIDTECSMILQCLRYIVDEDFFKGAPPPDETQAEALLHQVKAEQEARRVAKKETLRAQLLATSMNEADDDDDLVGSSGFGLLSGKGPKTSSGQAAASSTSSDSGSDNSSDSDSSSDSDDSDDDDSDSSSDASDT